jgi:hypothetical protein
VARTKGGNFRVPVQDRTNGVRGSRGLRSFCFESSLDLWRHGHPAGCIYGNADAEHDHFAACDDSRPGILSVFGLKTPVPYPFGSERTGHLVTNLDEAVRAARADGADVLVSPFNDPIGRDAVIQRPGGVNMQLYWHTTAPSYPALKTIPENRAYVSPEKAAAFTRSFLAFSHGKIISDNASAHGSRRLSAG